MSDFREREIPLPNKVSGKLGFRGSTYFHVMINDDFISREYSSFEEAYETIKDVPSDVDVKILRQDQMFQVVHHEPSE